MAEILGPGFIDTIFKELVTKKLTMQGDIIMNGNALHMDAGTVQWGYLKIIGTDIKIVQGAGYSLRLTKPVNDLVLGNAMSLNSQKLKAMKKFTTAPALADMDLNEIAQGDGTGPTAQDELFFKPDADKIVALASDGTARTITT